MWLRILIVALSFAPTAADALRRVAVVVGANEAAPGRKRLRYAHADARATAAVLRDIAGFDRVDVLLDPSPREILATLDRALRGTAAESESLLVFYYSGHADGRALYPAGKLLPLSELRKRLDSPRATVRLGILDACRGGGWTGAKNLQ